MMNRYDILLKYLNQSLEVRNSDGCYALGIVKLGGIFNVN